MFVQSVADVDLQNLGSLEYLDLSRNLIKEILPGTFLGMQSLKGLDFSVNVVRKVDFLIFDNFNAFNSYPRSSVADLLHFDTDPDPRIRTSVCR